MKKYFLLLLMLLLVACGTAAPGPTANEESANDAASPTGNSESDSESDNEESAGDTNSSAQNSTSDLEPVAPIQPSTFPLEVSQIRGRDWTKGAADPAVTIIEYGDFQ